MNEISNEEFVLFLHDLGVETYNQSFEWLLSDNNFSGVLKWMFKNLDRNNALTAREEYRFKEIDQQGALLSPEDLASAMATIKDNYPGICIPGDDDSLEDIELDIYMQKERLSVLERHEIMIQDLIQKNEQIKEELTLEQARLSAAHHQCLDDERTFAEECTTLAPEVEAILDEVVDCVADNLEVYASCKGDKDIANRFFAFAPLDSYMQAHALLRSHFDLYVAKNLVNRQNDITDEEVRNTLVEAKTLEERLSDAAFAYLDSKAELSGVQAKLALVSSYTNVHPSQITPLLLETQSALDLLEQEDKILEQETQDCVHQFVSNQTNLAINAATATALHIRQQMLSSLTHLADVWQQAYSLDRLLYLCLRTELRTLEEFVQFASQLSQYVSTENNAVADRMSSMSEIYSAHESCELKQTSNLLLTTLTAMLGASAEPNLIKLYDKLNADVMELRQSAEDGLRRKEEGLVEMRKSSQALVSYVSDGCTKQATGWDRAVSALARASRLAAARTERRLLDLTALFTSVKNGDKQHLRKLWQWFLTDPPRMFAAIKKARSY